MNSDEKKCLECQQTIGEQTHYWLFKDKGVKGEVVCSNCWNKNQETYKQNYAIIKQTTGYDYKIIKTKCDIEHCGKSFLIDSAEAFRHKYYTYKLDVDDHYELNEDPSPVNSMEELVQRWMKKRNLKKIRIGDGEVKTWDEQGEKDATAMGLFGWPKALREWLKKQPNGEFTRQINSTDNLNISESERVRNSESSSELEQIRQYFQDNNIKSIELNGDELIITYNERGADRLWTSANTPQLRQIKSYLQNQGKKSISLSELKQSQTGKNNWTPWIIGGIVGGGIILGLIAYFVWFRKKDNHE